MTEELSKLAETCRDELDRQGFGVVPGFLTGEELAAGQEAFARIAPTPEELAAYGPGKFSVLQQNVPAGAFGGSGLRQWPHWDDDVILDQSTSPKMVSLVRQIIGVDHVRLGPFALLLMAKYGGLGDHDQAMHMDRIGLVYPQLSGPRRAIRTWIYYSDVTENSGPTCFAPPEFTKDVPLGINMLARDEYPEIYENEVAAVGPAGSLLIWTNPGTYHRGSALGPAPNYRWVSGGDWHAAGSEWMGTSPLRGFDDRIHKLMRQFMARATIE
jgi:hypothetical protein